MDTPVSDLDSFLGKVDPSPANGDPTLNNNNDGMDGVSALRTQLQQRDNEVLELSKRFEDMQSKSAQSFTTLTEQLAKQNSDMTELLQLERQERLASANSQFDLSQEEIEALPQEAQSAVQKFLQKSLMERGLHEGANPQGSTSESVLTQELEQVKTQLQQLLTTQQNMGQRSTDQAARVAGVNDAMRDPRFNQYLETPVGYTGRTIRDELKVAYESGNENAMREIVKQFSGDQSSGSQSPMATPVSGGGSTPRSGKKYSKEEYEQVKTQYLSQVNKPLTTAQKEKLSGAWALMQEALQNGQVDGF